MTSAWPMRCEVKNASSVFSLASRSGDGRVECGDADKGREGALDIARATPVVFELCSRLCAPHVF